MTLNPLREHRKKKLEQELLKIKIEELSERALERGSFYRDLVKAHPSEDRFYKVLPRYIYDCLQNSEVMTAGEMDVHIRVAVERIQEIYNSNSSKY